MTCASYTYSWLVKKIGMGPKRCFQQMCSSVQDDTNSARWETWGACLNHVSGILIEAIQHVDNNFPYWRRRNGADHFTAFSYDHGVDPLGRV